MDYLALLAAFLIFTIGVTGVILNSMTIYIFIKEKSLQNSFNLICFTRASINAAVTLFMFLLIFTVDLILGFSPYSKIFEFVIISCSMSLYIANECTTVLIAVNRFIAIYAPIFYSRFFGIKVTGITILVILLSRAIGSYQDLSFYIPNDCYLIFSVEYLSYFPEFNGNCTSNEVSDAFLSSIFFFVLVLVLNIATFSKIAVFVFQNRAIDRNADQRWRKNSVLFLQTIFQDSLCVIDMVFTFKLSNLSSTRIWTLISYVLVWETIYMFDGLIMLLFNEKISFLKKHLFSKSPPESMFERSRSKITTQQGSDLS